MQLTRRIDDRSSYFVHNVWCVCHLSLFVLVVAVVEMSPPVNPLRPIWTIAKFCVHLNLLWHHSFWGSIQSVFPPFLLPLSCYFNLFQLMFGKFGSWPKKRINHSAKHWKRTQEQQIILRRSLENKFDFYKYFWLFRGVWVSFFVFAKFLLFKSPSPMPSIMSATNYI